MIYLKLIPYVAIFVSAVLFGATGIAAEPALLPFVQKNLLPYRHMYTLTPLLIALISEAIELWLERKLYS